MFTKADFIGYFKQLARLEQQMVENVEDLLRHVTDETARRQLAAIMDDEVRHGTMLEEINWRMLGNVLGDGNSPAGE
jgi:hypothetical protein